jgi:thiol-disulfide isomerase/thioredoxin
MVVVGLSGQAQALTDMLGEKLTVVLFWSSGQALGREQFRRLESEWFQPFRSAGVNVVAINVGDSPSLVGDLYRSVGGTFPCLLDEEKAAFDAVATAKLPRTYLLDYAGRILWLDIEYSRDMRRELKNALYYFLQAKTPPNRS